jgi:hypothetical protein
MRTTTNKGLRVWDQPNDDFNPTDLAFNWDAIDAAFATVVFPGTEIVYTAIAADTTTTNTVDPGATLLTFSAAAFTNTKHYLRIEIPRVSHSVATGTIRFRLQESAADVAGIIGTQLHATAAAFTSVNITVPFTPTAASHTYNIKWWTTNAGTLTIGSTGFTPAIFRIIKA